MTQDIEQDTTVAQLGTRLRDGTLTIRAVMEHYLSVIEAENAQLNAFRTVFRETALARAERLQAELDAGQDRGPLHGIPIAIKDNIDLRGAARGSGSLTQRVVCVDTAPALQNLLDAGGVVLGQTNMVEFAFGGWGTNSAMGTPWNPLDRSVHRVPGGSSSGSGVAVAAGMVPIALGSDTGGSVRIPAAMNGLAGYKPSWGDVSSVGLTPLSSIFDVIGPLAHNVEDCRTAFRILAGQRTTSALPGARIARRIGVADIAAYGGCSVQLREIFATLYRRLETSGFELVPFTLPVDVRDVLEATGRIIGYEANVHFDDIARTQGACMDRGVLSRIVAASNITREDYDREIALRNARVSEMCRRFDGFDVFLFPTTSILPPAVHNISEAEMPLGDLTRMVNYLDLCAQALPFQMNGGALPHSLQVIGRKHADEDVLATAHRVEDLLKEPLSTKERNQDASGYEPAR